MIDGAAGCIGSWFVRTMLPRSAGLLASAAPTPSRFRSGLVVGIFWAVTAARLPRIHTGFPFAEQVLFRFPSQPASAGMLAGFYSQRPVDTSGGRLAGNGCAGRKCLVIQGWRLDLPSKGDSPTRIRFSSALYHKDEFFIGGCKNKNQSLTPDLTRSDMSASSGAPVRREKPGVTDPTVRLGSSRYNSRACDNAIRQHFGFSVPRAPKPLLARTTSRFWGSH
jgi:hypothetical protein